MALASPLLWPCWPLPQLKHGPLEVLITGDEETGMTGAHQLPEGWLRGRYLLNLDSEEDGALTIGCAGGLDSVVRGNPDSAAPPPNTVARAITLANLQGGHSGIQIDKGRTNALSSF